MTSARWGHSATLLTNGKVLIAGGTNQSDAQDSAELFDSDTNTFTPVSTMNSPRMHHTATALLDGRVLLAGGWSSYLPITPLASAELFDPETNTFTAVGNMNIPRWDHRAYRLPDGRVLISGGDRFLFSTSLVELFDPVSGSFAMAGNLIQGRKLHTTTLLKSGNVLVVGGIYDFSGSNAPEYTVLATSELYSPDSKTSVEELPLKTPRVAHTATLLDDGRVVVIGGTDSADSNGALATAEIINTSP